MFQLSITHFPSLPLSRSFALVLKLSSLWARMTGDGIDDGDEAITSYTAKELIDEEKILSERVARVKPVRGVGARTVDPRVKWIAPHTASGDPDVWA